jgi:formate dehydrogenase gamma subunit
MDSRESGDAGEVRIMNEQRFLRFPLAYRIEHWILTLSFTTLAITGLVQKYPLNNVSQAIVGVLGGIVNTRTIHHVAAIVLMLEVVYHIGVVGYRMFVLRLRPTMMPGIHDIRNAWGTLLYNLGLADERPPQGRYTFEEKAEYWAVVWGTAVMAITGFLMWNPIASAKLLPGEFIPAAKSAHGWEALLAVLAIIIWHLYHVHIRSFNMSMFTGYLTEEEMREEHGVELAQYQAREDVGPRDPDQISARQRIYVPIYAVVAVILTIGIYMFATFEQTAIETLPPAEDVVIYAPLTATPFPTALPTQTPSERQATTWDDGIGAILQSSCGSCHGGATSMGGLDLATYADAMSGGNSGPVIVPNEPDNSELVRLQAAGGHPGQLSGNELEIIRDWISNGALEK